MREIKNRYLAFPEGPVFAGETPDFLVRSEGTREMVGIEITELLRRTRRRGGSPHRERWWAEEKVKSRAEELYYGGPEGNPRGVLPGHAHLGWLPAPERPEKLPGGVEATAAAIARLVGEAEPEWRDGGQLRLGPKRLSGTPLDGVLHSLEVRRETHLVGEDGRASGWTASRSHPIKSAAAVDILEAIRGKDGVYGRCKEVCGEAWLAIALVGGGDSYQTVGEEVLARPFPSAFDRLLLLCTEGGPGSRVVFELRRTHS